MGRYSGKACRLLSMLSLTASFFLVEIIVGYVTNSIALVADSFHMLSDVVALIVGFASVRISKWKSPKNTFGWARAEVLGALVNAVFLIALCFSITIEALKRLIQVEEIENPKLMLIVGGAGLAINLVGLCLFHNHGHSHGGGGHGHSHGGGGQSHKSHNDQSENNSGHGPETDALVETRNLTNGSTVRNHDSNSCDIEIEDADILVEVNTEPGRKVSSSSQLNMRGVFLHVLGDALGSVIVVISALLIWFIEADWKYYVDPAMSLFMVVIIVSTTIPLLKESSFILLQTVPGHIIVSDIKEKLAKIPGVIAVHELHVWQLAGSKLIASVHVQCGSMSDYTTNIAQKIKDTFHEEGIHSSTIQPEIIDEEAYSSTCALECGPDKHCYQDTCCAERVKKPNGSRGDSPANKNGSAKNIPPFYLQIIHKGSRSKMDLSKTINKYHLKIIHRQQV